MIDRSEIAVAVVLPLVAVVWVFADAASGVVSASADRPAPAAIVPLAEAANPSVALWRTASRADDGDADACASDSAVAPQASTASVHPALRRLCQAGLKFTIGLPKS